MIRVRVKKRTGHIGPEMEAKGHQLVVSLALYIEGQAKRYVPVRTGHLRRSITHEIRGKGRARVGTAVNYARIQEVGGTIPPHEIRPKRKKALSFDWPKGGGRVAFRRVKHPGGKIRGKFYMKRAMEDGIQAIKPIARRIFK